MSERTNKATSGQNVLKSPKSKFRAKSQQEQTAESKLRMEKRGEQLDKAKEKLAKQNITLETDENLTEFICQKSGISHSGARNISNTVAIFLEDKISDMILSGRLSSSDTATVCVNNDKIDIKVYSKAK
jgi:ATP-dependent Clp protease ATP-binding subunit ClpA